MKASLSSLLLAASVQQASAHFFDALAFECPATSTDVCVEQQATGFDWSTLSIGSFSSYGSFDFSGFTCASSFGFGFKRDLGARTSGFQSKCITGKATKEIKTAPKISCGSSFVDKFSIDTFQISVEYDVDLEFHYGMADGSTCKQKSSCKSSGTTVKNTQCGGAIDVAVVIPSPPKGKSSCNVGFHNIGFKCATTTKSTTAVSSKATTVAKTISASTKATEVKETTSAVQTKTTAIEVKETTTAQITTAISSGKETTVIASSIQFSNSTAFITKPAATVVSVSSAVPVESTTAVVPVVSVTPEASVPVTSEAPVPVTSAKPTTITTLFVEKTTTICPVTLIQTTAGVVTTITTSSISTAFVTKTSVITSAITVSVPAVSTKPATPEGPVPSVLPSCMNTWLKVSGCGSNTDAACYCPSSDFTVLVFECLAARGADSDEIIAAQSYFQGICAAYVPQNPAIVTAVPITAPPATVTATVPVTTISVQTVITVPVTDNNGATVPGTVGTTTVKLAVTVPQVVFVTVSGVVGPSLVPGPAAPATIYASTTPAAPIVPGATFAPVASFATGTGAVGTGSLPIPTSPATAVFTGAAGRQAGGVAGAIGAAIAVAAFAL